MYNIQILLHKVQNKGEYYEIHWILLKIQRKQFIAI